jgi:predicted outer membrane repeat protein
MKKTLAIIMLSHALAITGTRADTLYVNGRGSDGDGKSWRTACRNVGDALQKANPGDVIWVATGKHVGAIQLKTGVALYGGFVGNESSLDQRSWQKNPTILDGNGSPHVVTGADQAILDGFTITGGKGSQGGPAGVGLNAASPNSGRGGRPIHTTPQAVMSGANNGSGAGMVNFQVAPTVRNCIFENNEAGKGGGVYNMTSTSFPPRPDANSKVPVFINCVFRNNTGRGRGGGVSNDVGTAPVFLNCVFEGNKTPQKGGGMYNDFGCSPTLINCLFTGNSAESAAGMGNDGGSSPVLYFCTFTKNHATDYGAPLYQGTGPASNPTLINCLITGNTCDWEDPGIYNWHDCTPLIKNTGADTGYKSGRFTESQLPQLLADLRQYKAQPVREPVASAPEKIPSAQRVISVKGDAKALQNALEEAGKDGAEVRVAPGVYKLNGTRIDTFTLRPGVRVFGEGKVTLDGNGAFHVVTGANGALLDGIIITGGHADGVGYDGKGGGLINYQRGVQRRPNSDVVSGFTMTLNTCTFINNVARDGGAVYSYDRAKPVFTACVFTGNRAENGAAVLDRVGVESTFKKCEFIGNTAKWRGGAVYFDYGSRPRLTGCVFRNNTTDGHGGAAFSVSRASQLENTAVTLTDCRFETNSAKGNGGAAAFCDSSISAVRNCAFIGNKAGQEGNDVYTDSSSTGGGLAQPAAPNDAGEGAVRNAAGSSRRGGDSLATQFQPAADFSVVIIGSGSPQYDPKRSGPSVAIQYRGRFILVDMGNGTQARLNEAGISMAQIDALFLTHHHRDHDEEFIPILNTALVRGMPLEIVGTPGTKKLAEFTEDFYAEDILYRMGRMGSNAQTVRKPGVREVKGGESFRVGALHVKTTQVPHSMQTVAYRFEVGGQSIVISGDLTYSTNLIELARGADVLVMDSGGSIVHPGAAAAGGGRQSVAHASAHDVANMARESGAKKLLLTHIAATEVDEEATIKAIHEVYKGDVVVGADLLQIAPAGAKPATPTTRSSSRFIQRLDKDGDGKVSRSEFDGPKDRFGDWDKNGDGFVTEDEAPTGAPRMGAGRDGAAGGE